MFSVDPSAIFVPEPVTGTGNMGDVTDKASICRWTMDVPRFLPVFFRMSCVDLTGGTPANATLSLKKDHGLSTTVPNFTLATVANVGTGGSGYKSNVHLRLQEDELYTWLLKRGQWIVAEYTNPDSGYLRWSAEIGLIDAQSLLRT